MNKLDERSEGNVFRCPILDKTPNNNDCEEIVDHTTRTRTPPNDKISSTHIVHQTPSEKCQLSMNQKN